MARDWQGIFQKGQPFERQTLALLQALEVDVATALAGASVASVFSRTGAVTATDGDYYGVVASAKTGATQAARFVGATASGAPVSGAFSVGDFVVDRSGSMWICSGAGSPGTWTQVTASALSSGVLTNAMVNAAAAIAYSKLNLAGSVVNADIAGSAAIAYSKLNLSGSLVNADIASGAAIGISKLAGYPSDATKVLQGDGTWAVPTTIPTGTILEYGAASAPSGYLLCDGSAVSRTTYAALFAVLSTTYGVGDGSTTFNVPDFRGRVAVGYAASGGHTDVSTLNNNDGVSAANRRPKHRHSPHTHNVTLRGTSGANNVASGTGDNINNSTVATTSVDGGSGNANDSLDAPAYIVVNRIIKT